MCLGTSRLPPFVPGGNWTASLLVDDIALPSMESMEALQLLVNVIVITAATTLALTAHLQRRDKRILTVELNLGREPDQHEPTAITPSTMDHGRDCKETRQLPMVPTPINHDIRQYVANRAREWAKLSVAATTSAAGRSGGASSNPGEIGY